MYRYAHELPQGYYTLFLLSIKVLGTEILKDVGDDRFPIAALIRQEPVLFSID